MTAAGNRPRSPIPTEASRGVFAVPATSATDDVMRDAGAPPAAPEPTEEPASRAAAPKRVAAQVAVQRRTPSANRRTGRQSAGTRAPSALIPAAPEDRYVDRQQLNVRITKELHWALRASSFMTNDSMSRVITKFLEAYAEDPEVWLDLFTVAAENGTPIGDALNPAVRAALASLLDE